LRRAIAFGARARTHGVVIGLPCDGRGLGVDIWRIEDGLIAEHWDGQ
jgi:predicted SnoaL-like aldol condensation-catalyzing enzyme